MGKETPTCPSCGLQIRPNVVECPDCGVNLKTGETFEEKVKRAKQKKFHVARAPRGLVMLPTAGFAIIVFAGFMFQRASERVMRTDAQEFHGYVRQLEEVDRLVRQGENEEARTVCEGLIDELSTTLFPPLNEQLYRYRSQEPDRGKFRFKKVLLFNLRSKANRYLKYLDKIG